MLKLNKEKIYENFGADAKSYASVCNSCACGKGQSSCNSTCKGCKDKGENISGVKKIYKLNK